jgi:hypothetical protein
MDGKISLHSVKDGKRLTQSVKPLEVRMRGFNAWHMWEATVGKVS